jgi:hypothetical protein
LAKEITQIFKVSKDILPSEKFLGTLDDAKQEKVARIIAELEVRTHLFILSSFLGHLQCRQRSAKADYRSTLGIHAYKDVSTL